MVLVGEVKHIASCNILVANNNPPKIFLRDFCFVMKLINCKSTCTAREPRLPHFKFNNLLNEHFPLLFFKSVLCVKSGEVEVNRYSKWYNRCLCLLHMLLPVRIYIARGPWHVGDFCNIFLPNINEDQKKSYYLSEGPWHWAIWQIRR